MTISSTQQLLELAGRSVGRGRPAVEALENETLAPDLRRALDAHRPSGTIPRRTKARLSASARRAAPITFSHGRRAAIDPVELPTGGYDLVVALRLRVASATLAAVQANGELPSEVPLDDDQRGGLLLAMALTLTGVPTVEEGSGEQVAVGTWHLGPPELTPSPASDTGAILRIPYTIEVLTAGPGEPLRATTTLTGHLQHAVELGAMVEGDRVTAALSSGDLPEGVDPITIAPDSLLQPASPESLTAFVDALAGEIDSALRSRIDAAEELSACPRLTVPIGSGIQVRIQRVDLRVRDVDGGLLMVGALVGEGADPPEGAGDPARLRPPRMPDAADVHARLDEALLDKLVRQAFRAGELQELVDEEARDLPYDVRVDAAGVEVDPSGVRIRLDVTGIDVCLESVDVSAEVAVEFRIAVANGRVRVERTTDVTYDDEGVVDLVLCALAGLLDLMLASLAHPLIIHRLAHYAGVLGGLGGGPQLSVVSGVIDPGSPIPLSESLPTVEVLQVFSTSGSVESLGSVTIAPDERNTYLYLRVLQQVGDERVPVDDAVVTVVDQDAPRPRGDAPPKVPEDSHEIKPKIQTTVTHRFVPPRDDQVLASGRTDVLGKLRLRLSPQDRATTAGSIETTTTTTTVGNFPRPGGAGRPGSDPFGDPGRPDDVSGRDKTEVHTTTRPVREATPDIYVTVRLADGAVVDSRTLPSGFFPNVRAGRIGSPEDPLELVITRADG